MNIWRNKEEKGTDARKDKFDEICIMNPNGYWSGWTALTIFKDMICSKSFHWFKFQENAYPFLCTNFNSFLEKKHSLKYTQEQRKDTVFHWDQAFVHTEWTKTLAAFVWNDLSKEMWIKNSFATVNAPAGTKGNVISVSTLKIMSPSRRQLFIMGSNAYGPL